MTERLLFSAEKERAIIALASLTDERGIPTMEYGVILTALGEEDTPSARRRVSKVVNRAGIRRRVNYTRRAKIEQEQESSSEPILTQPTEIFEPDGNDFLLWIRQEIIRGQSVAVGKVNGILDNITNQIKQKLNI